MLYRLGIVLTAICVSNGLLADQAFVTSFLSNDVFMFDTASTQPATLVTTIPSPANITFSADGTTIYITSLAGDDVETFLATGPYTPTPLGVSVSSPSGIAISSDNQTGYIAAGLGSPGLYSFPTGGDFPHTATQLNATSTVIANPFLIAIQGDFAFVGDFQHSTLYQVALNATDYAATLVQSFTDRSINGITISSDGYLYISSVLTAGSIGQVLRVPVAAPASTPQLVATNINSNVGGLAASSNGSTVFVTALASVFSFPTNQGFPQTPTALSYLAIPNSTSIAIYAIPSPLNLTVQQNAIAFLLQTDLVNILNWQADPLSTVSGYNVYRNGSKIATLSNSTFTYQDHNRTKGTTCYAVTAFNANGTESFAATACSP